MLLTELTSRDAVLKAIAGVAYGYQFPQIGPLKPHQFSGGYATVKRVLESLGFSVLRR
jgi:hypothetical protein